MCAFELFLSVDPSLGRVDYSLLSDQTLMEMLYGGFDEETKRKFQDKEGMFLDVCKWVGVKCDANERVVEIKHQGRIRGSLQLSRLPSEVTCINISRNDLEGSIDLSNLPPNIEQIHLERNHLTGSVDLTKLPENVGILNLTKNCLSGSLELAQLPRSMRFLFIFDNQFSGSFIATNLPKTLCGIFATDNQFNPIAVVDSQTTAQIRLGDSGVTSVVDENGNEKVEGIFL